MAFVFWKIIWLTPLEIQLFHLNNVAFDANKKFLVWSFFRLSLNMKSRWKELLFLICCEIEQKFLIQLKDFKQNDFLWKTNGDGGTKRTKNDKPQGVKKETKLYNLKIFH